MRCGIILHIFKYMISFHNKSLLQIIFISLQQLSVAVSQFHTTVHTDFIVYTLIFTVFSLK